MPQSKNKTKESKSKAVQAKPQSRMDTLLQEIDRVIAKKKCSDKTKSKPQK